MLPRHFFLAVKGFCASLKPSRNTIGSIGERIVILMLKMKLHKILHHRYRTSVGEIDIISLRGKSLFFTEVKTSMSRYCFTDIPLYAKQRASILRAIKLFLLRNPRFNTYEIRIEICIISLATGINWIRNAWEDSRW